MSSQSDDDVFIHSSPHIHHSFSSPLISINMMKTYPDLPCMDVPEESKVFPFISLIDDTVNSSIRPMKSCTFATQDNGNNNERDMPIPRKQSVLDEKALREDDTKTVRDQRIQTMSQNYRVILESIGEDPSRQGKVSLHWVIFHRMYFLSI